MTTTKRPKITAPGGRFPHQHVSQKTARAIVDRFLGESRSLPRMGYELNLGGGHFLTNASGKYHFEGPEVEAAYRAQEARRRKVHNPEFSIPSRPRATASTSGTALERAWERWEDAIAAMPVRIARTPSYVRDMWEWMIEGYGKISDGHIVTFDKVHDEDLWRKHPSLKGKRSASIRLTSDGDVVATGAQRNPAKKRKATARKRPAAKRRSR